MQGLPLFHRIAGQPVLVVGEGEAADAKARLVEEAGGQVVRAPVPGVRIAFVALEDGAEAEAARLKAMGYLVNVVDKPALCDFTVPAIVDRSPVLVAVGTGGASASLAKALKERLEVLLPAGLGAVAAAIFAGRRQVAAVHGSVPERRAFWAAALAPGGPLDPLVPQSDPAAGLGQALAGQVAQGETTTLDVTLADALTLKELRLLAQADLVVHAADTPAEVLALVRRDAARLVGTAAPEGSTGRIVLLRMRSGA